MHERRKLYWLFTAKAKAKAAATRKRNKEIRDACKNSFKFMMISQREGFIKKNNLN